MSGAALSEAAGSGSGSGSGSGFVCRCVPLVLCLWCVGVCRLWQCLFDCRAAQELPGRLKASNTANPNRISLIPMLIAACCLLPATFIVAAPPQPP